MSRGKSPSSSLAVDPHIAELRMLLSLHEVVRDLVDKLQLTAEDLAKASATCSKMIRRLMIAKLPPDATAFR
jgi:hypothetical protein